jgi:hypothetical protein
VIPIAAFTSMVHTLSGIVLHRLYRMMRTGDAPAETRAVVEAMVGLVKELDPAFFDRIGQGPLGETEIVETRLPRFAQDGTPGRPARCQPRKPGVPARRPHGTGGADDRRRCSRGARRHARHALRRRRARAAAQPSQNRCRLETLQLSVHSRSRARAPRELHVPEEALAHGRQPGPAPPMVPASRR